MNKTIQVSVSILCADFANLEQEIKAIEKSGADLIHVDVMDGHFVLPITVGPMIVKAIRPLTKLPIDVHFMVEHPELYVDEVVDAGADMITMHAECFGKLKPECREFGEFPKEIESLDADRSRRVIDQIKKRGKRAFMVISPGTGIQVLDPVLDVLDGVLVMSVNPGFSHQKFMPVALSKIQYLRDHFDGDIAIDGGINEMTGVEAVKAGVNILATASYFYNAQDKRDCVKKLKSGIV